MCKMNSRFLKNNSDAIGAVKNIVNIAVMIFGVFLVYWQLNDASFSQKGQRSERTIGMMNEYLGEIFPEVVKSSYAFIEIGEQSWSWRPYSFPTGRTDATFTFDAEAAATGHLSIEKLIVLTEPFFKKVTVLSAVELIDMDIMCSAVGDEALAYVHVILAAQFGMDMHTAYTGQVASASKTFVSECYRRFGDDFVEHDLHKSFLAEVYGHSNHNIEQNVQR